MTEKKTPPKPPWLSGFKRYGQLSLEAKRKATLTKRNKKVKVTLAGKQSDERG